MANQEPLSRLQKLAVDLKKAYAKVSKHVTKMLTPIESAVAEIGETWKPAHYAEQLRDHEKAAVVPPTQFAHETFTNGDESDYVLCAGRGPDRKCGLYVSICKYRVATVEDAAEEKSPEVVIRQQLLVPTSALPVPLRLKLLDVLDAFAEGYEEHVRQTRQSLLTDWVSAAAEEPAAVEAPPEGGNGNNGEIADELEGGRGRVKLFSPDGASASSEQWLPSLPSWSGKR